jgi:L-methionine (R)-S-oxide reductase
MNKSEAYQQATARIDALIEGETDVITVMSTIACELYHAFEYVNWAGFYRRVNQGTLKVGPYQGGHGCLTIDINRGVCGACARTGEIQIENDVSQATDHLACSSDTRAEIVLPILDRTGAVAAVLDIDSTDADVFDETDATYLVQICASVAVRLQGAGDPVSRA